MKGKKGTYILLIVVCAIWIGIAFEIINAFSGDEQAIADINRPIKSKEIQKIEKEIFSIKAVERDPFLGVLTNKKVVKKNPKKISKPKKNINWPRIKYKGIIRDKKGTAVYLIEVNGMVQLMKKGAVESELTLLNGNQSTITLLYKKERKEFEIVN